MLWAEERIARRRINNLLVTEALLIQAAASSVISEQGGRHFNELIERLTDGEP